MENYLLEIFGLNVKIETWNGKSKLPLYLRNKREYYLLTIEGAQSILMKNNSDNFSVSVFEKEKREIEKYAGMPVVLWLDAMSTYQRNALIRNRISFIVPYSQFYVPELGMCLKEYCAGKRAKVDKLPAMTQFLLLYFIYQKKNDEKSQAELAKYLNISAMNMSRAVQELQEIGLLETRRDGNRKMVKSVAAGRELYHLSGRYLQSPVQKKIYVSLMHFDMELPVAGELALAKQSMLNEPKYMIYAMDKKYAKDIPKEYVVEPKLMTDQSYVQIELWKYSPLTYAKNGLVDIVSLVQSLKEIEDERVELQIEETMERYRW